MRVRAAIEGGSKEVTHAESGNSTGQTDMVSVPRDTTAALSRRTILQVQRLAGNHAIASILSSPERPVVQRQFHGPPVATGGGSGFDHFIHQFQQLEALAIQDGYSLMQRVTAFRKIFYDSSNPRTTYAGLTTGGGAWNILIPGAAQTGIPPSWQSPIAQGAMAYLRSHPVQTIGNRPVDMGHLLTGADARAHPTSISLGTVTMRSNVEASTFTGDLGSVVFKYLTGSQTSFRDTAMDLQQGLLAAQYSQFASVPDITGDADAYSLELDPGRTLTQNLVFYYTSIAGHSHQRWSRFGAAIGLGTFSGGRFPGNTPAWRSTMRAEVMQAALAFAAANGARAHVALVSQDPSPGIISPTYWEAYRNISGWVVDEFLRDITARAATE